jgi:hypothetical protein
LFSYSSSLICEGFWTVLFVSVSSLFPSQIAFTRSLRLLITLLILLLPKNQNQRPPTLNHQLLHQNRRTLQ